MDLPAPIHDFPLVFLGLGLIVDCLGVVTNPIYSAFSLGLILACISLFHIVSNSHFVVVAQLLIYVGVINVLIVFFFFLESNVLIVFVVMFMNGLEYYNDFHLWTVGDGITSLVCTNIIVSLITTISDTSCYGIIWTTRLNQIIEQDLIKNGQQIGIHLSTDFFLPLNLFL